MYLLVVIPIRISSLAGNRGSRLGQFDLLAYLVCSDGDEINDIPLTAHTIATDNASRGGYLYLPQDADWFRFQVVAGERYLISTSNLGTGVNTYVELFDQNGASVLAADDNSGGGYAVR